MARAVMVAGQAWNRGRCPWGSVRATMREITSIALPALHQPSPRLRPVPSPYRGGMASFGAKSVLLRPFMSAASDLIETMADGRRVLRFTGNLTLLRVRKLSETLKDIEGNHLVVDLTEVDRMDTVGAWLVHKLE